MHNGIAKTSIRMNNDQEKEFKKFMELNNLKTKEFSKINGN
jgi:hypothetical protein